MAFKNVLPLSAAGLELSGSCKRVFIAFSFRWDSSRCLLCSSVIVSSSTVGADDVTDDDTGADATAVVVTGAGACCSVFICEKKKHEWFK